MDVGDLKVNLKLNADGFDVTANRAGAAMGTLTRQFAQSADAAQKTERAVGALGSSFRRMIVTIGALRFALLDLDDFFLSFPKSVANTAGEFQRMEVLMAGLSKASDETQRSLEGFRDMGAVLEFARTAPFDVKTLSDVFVKLKSGGIDPLAGSMEALVNGVAKFGGSSEVLKRASVAIQQIAGKGVVSMEELRQQLGEAIPNAIRLMAQGLGLTVSELTDRVSKGIVKSETALAKLFAQMRLDSQGAAEELKKTLPGAFSQLKTEYQLFQNVVANEGFTAALTATAQELTAFFQSAKGQQFGRELGQSLLSITEGLISMGRWIANNIDLLKQLGVLLVAGLGGSKLAGVYKKIADESRAARAEEAKGIKEKSDSLNQQVDQTIRNQEKESAAFRAAQAEKISGAEKELAMQTAKRDQQLRYIKEVRGAELSARQQADQFANRLDKGLKPKDGFTDNQAEFDYFNRKADLAARELELQNKLAVARQAQVDGTNRHIAALRGETFAKSAAGIENAKLIGQIQQQVAAHNKNIAALTGVSGALRAGATAAKGFGLALLAGLGWAAAFFIAVEGIIFLFGKFTKSAREAEEAQQALNRARLGQSVAGDEKKLTVGLDAAKKKLDELMKKKGELAAKDIAGKASGKGGLAAQEQLEYIELGDEIKRTKLEMQDFVDKTAAAARDLQNQAVASGASTIVESVRREAKARFEALRLDEKRRKLESQLRALPEEQRAKSPINKQIKDVGLEGSDAELRIFKEAADARIKGMKGVQADVRKVAEEGLNQQIDQLQKQRDAVASNDNFIASTKPGKKIPDTALDRFIEASRSKLIDLGEVSRELEDGLTTVANIQAFANKKVDDLVKANKGSINPAKKEDQVKIAAAKELLALQVQESQTNKAIEVFQRIQEQTGADRQRIEDAFANGGQELDRKIPGLASLDKLIADLAPKRELISKELEKLNLSFEEFAASQRQLVISASIADDLTGLIAKTKDINDSLETDDRERQKRITQTRIDEVTKRVASEARALTTSGQLSDQQVNQLKLLYGALGQYVTAELAKLEQNNMGAVEKLTAQWANGEQALKDASAGWLDDFVNKISEGKFKFTDFVTSILNDIAKIQLKQNLSGSINGIVNEGTAALGRLFNIKGPAQKSGAPGAGGGPSGDGTENADLAKIFTETGEAAEKTKAGLLGVAEQGLVGMAQSLITSVFGTNAQASASTSSALSLSLMTSGIGQATTALFALSFAANNAAASQGASALTSAFSSFFAGGGIMSGKGSMPLKKYSNGGIANSAQLAVFGEGRMNEAYVPLPDGRTIPVTVTSSAGQGGGAAPSVTVNVINQTSQPVSAQQGQPRFDGKQMVLDVILGESSRPGPFRDGMRNMMKG